MGVGNSGVELCRGRWRKQCVGYLGGVKVKHASVVVEEGEDLGFRYVRGEGRLGFDFGGGSEDYLDQLLQTVLEEISLQDILRSRLGNLIRREEGSVSKR